MASHSLPAYASVILDTFSGSLADNTIRTEFESGEAEQRAVNSRKGVNYTFDLVVPHVNIQAFMSWMADTGSEYFTFHDPVYGQLREVRFVGGAGSVVLERGSAEQRIRGERVYVAREVQVEGFL